MFERCGAGGVISPLLLLIYTYDLPNVLATSTSIKIQLYAVHIKIYGIYSEENCVEVRSSLQSCLNNLSKWANSWDLTINLDKSMILHIGTGGIFDYKIDNVILRTCQSYKDLGVIVDAKLKFTDHIDYAVGRAYSCLFLLFRNTHTTCPAVLIRLYKSFVLPHLEYCSQVWNPFRKADSLKIEKVQHTFTRLLFKRISPRSELPPYSD